jgi:hypothetical protein
MATVVSVTLPRLQAAAETGFSVAQLRAFGVTTALADGTLQTLLNGAFSAIDAAIGPAGELVELLSARGDLLKLNRRAASVAEVVERAPWSPITLATDDYELSRSGRILTRLRTGTNPSWCWRGRVKATYLPVDDTAQRIRVAVALVKADIAYNPGLASQTIGTWAESYDLTVPYPEQRAAILASLSDSAGLW